MTVINLNDAAAFFGKTLTEKFRESTKRGLLSAAKRMATLIVIRYIPNAKPNQPVDRGAYKAAWGAGAEEDGAYYDNIAPHASFVEYGVRAGASKPGGAMIRAIAEWAVRKGLADPETASRAGFFIAMKIKSKGIEARAVMESANKDVLDQVIKEELEREMKRTVGSL